MNKKSFAKIIALVLTLVTVSAAFTSCGDNPFENIGDKFSVSLPDIEIKTKDEIRADGITAADVLAKYDELAQSVARSTMETDEFLSEEDMRGQFTSITVSNRLLDDEDTWAKDTCYVKNTWFYPELADQLEATADDNSEFDPYIKGENAEAYMGHTYQVSFNYVSENFGIGCNETINSWGVFCVKFEKVMNLFGVDNHEFTEDDYPTEGFNSGGSERTIYTDHLENNYDQLLGRTAYEAVVIDREFIADAETADQLWALYEMAESMVDVNFKGKLPGGTANVTVDESDDYGVRTVTTYDCYKHPSKKIDYYSDGSVKSRYEYEFDAEGRIIKYTYYEGESSVFADVFKQSFNEDGKLTVAYHTVAHEGYTKYEYSDATYYYTPYDINEFSIYEGYTDSTRYDTNGNVRY